MNYRLHIMTSDGDDSYFEITNKFTKIGSSDDAHIKLADDNIPPLACLLEYNQKAETLQIHSRASGILILDGNEFNEGVEIWSIGSVLNIGDDIKMTFESFNKPVVPQENNTRQTKPAALKQELPEQKIQNKNTTTKQKKQEEPKESESKSLTTVLSVIFVLALLFFGAMLMMPEPNGISYEDVVTLLTQEKFDDPQKTEEYEIFTTLTEAHASEKIDKDKSRQLYSTIKIKLQQKKSSEKLNKVQKFIDLRINNL
jgi:flagellar basal body-associated protein FliL